MRLAFEGMQAATPGYPSMQAGAPPPARQPAPQRTVLVGEALMVGNSGKGSMCVWVPLAHCRPKGASWYRGPKPAGRVLHHVVVHAALSRSLQPTHSRQLTQSLQPTQQRAIMHMLTSPPVTLRLASTSAAPGSSSRKRSTAARSRRPPESPPAAGIPAWTSEMLVYRVVCRGWAQTSSVYAPPKRATSPLLSKQLISRCSGTPTANAHRQPAPACGRAKP